MFDWYIVLWLKSKIKRLTPVQQQWPDGCSMSNANTSGLITPSRKIKYVYYSGYSVLFRFKFLPLLLCILLRPCPSLWLTVILESCAMGAGADTRSWKAYLCNKWCSCKMSTFFRHSRSSGPKWYWHGLNTLTMRFYTTHTKFNFENNFWYFIGCLVFKNKNLHNWKCPSTHSRFY